MIIRCDNGATIVLNDCHWTEGAYISVTHAGGASTVLDMAAIERVEAELARIKLAILTRRLKQRKVG